MKTQQDNKVRMVALDNLVAMCTRASVIAHRFQVSKVTRSRVHVTYNNPDEYGYGCAVTAILPCFPSVWPDDAENPRVLLEPLRVVGGRDSHDQEAAYQSIEALVLNGPTMFRAGDQWMTHQEMVASGRGVRPNQGKPGKCPSCYICDAEAK